MHIHCPHCRNPIEVIDDQGLRDVTCSSCGSSFNLLPDETVTRTAVEHRTLGHFELIDRIGVGAFGEVWTAHDSELDRTVAIKLPRKGQLTAEESESFLREARSAGRLNHPSIVAVHEVGRADDQLFIVSDYVRGVTLADWLTGTRPTPKEAAALVAQLADAVQHAHEHGVIHRDLKPSNIMLDETDQPHIMDFGLAKREAGEITMTMDGKILGTPAYMSPEQAKGTAHDANARSDVYSLGVILFELLTGELPFRGNARMLVHQVINEEPPSPRRLNGNVTRDMETIVLKCLEKEPHNRYSTAADLAEDLRRFLKGEPIQARPITLSERGWRWCRRNPMVSALAGGLVLALLAGLLGVTWQWMRAEDAAHRAVQSAANEKESRQAADEARVLAQDAAAAEKESFTRLKSQAYGLRTSTAFHAWEMGSLDRLQQLLGECVPQKGEPDLRGFEWRLLCGLGQEDSSAKTLTFNANVASFAYSGDSRYWAAALVNGEVRLHDESSGEEWSLTAADPKSQSWRIASAVTFSPDGKFLAAGGGDSQHFVRLWEVPSRNEIEIAVRHEQSIDIIAISPDGKLGVSLDGRAMGGTLTAWSIPDGTARWTAKTVATCVAFSPDANSRLLAISSWEKDVTFRDADTGQLHVDRSVNVGSQLRWLAFSQDGKRLATFGDGGICLWDMTTGKPVKKQMLTWGLSDGLAFSPNGDFVAANDSYHGSVVLWDVGNGQKVGRFLNAGALAFSADGRLLACRGGDKSIKLWNLGLNEARVFRADSTDWFPLATSPDKKTIATFRNKSPVLWDAATGEVRELGRHLSWCQAIAFSPNGNMLASGDQEGHIKLWDTHDQRLICPLEGHKGTGVVGVCALAFSCDGKMLASSGGKGDVRLWDVDSQRVQPLDGPQGSVLGLAFSPDGGYLVAGGGEAAKTFVWDVRNSIPRHVVTLTDQAAPGALAFSSDSKMLAVSGWSDRVFIYDTQTWRPSQELRTNWRLASGLVFSPDDRTLVAASPCGEVKFWQVATGQEVGTMRMNESVRRLSFLDENTLVTASMEGFVRVWRASLVGPR